MNGSFKRALALARKELYAYSYSAAFYGTAVVFLAGSSVLFFIVQNFFAMDLASLRSYFSTFPLLFVLVIPAITMKSWAEERKLGTVELLLTMPFSDWDLVLGKYLSSLGALALMLILTIPVPLSLLPLGHFEGGIIFAEYIGSLLLGSAAIALGLFLSCLSRNQAGAFLGSAVLLLVMMLIHQITFSMDLPAWLSGFINFISLAFHFESFSKGLLDSRDAAFFILTTLFFLYLNNRVLIFRKWS